MDEGAAEILKKLLGFEAEKNNIPNMYLFRDKDNIIKQNI